MDQKQHPPFPSWAVLACGAAAWVALQLLSGRGEAWDSPLWFAVQWPLITLAAGWLGARHGRIATRWVAAWAVGQVLGLVIANGFDDMSLWPIGLVLMALAHLPAWLLARHMARRRERRAAAAHVGES